MPDPRTLQPHAVLPTQHRLRRHLLRLTGALLKRQSGLRTRYDGLRVLLIRPDHLGDVILASPAFAALRAALPQAHVTALVGPWAEVVARRSPYLDAVLTLPFPGFARSPLTPHPPLPLGERGRRAIAPYQLAWREAQRLRAYHFDLAVVLRFDHWWGALLTALAGIPLRLGYDLPDVAPLLTHALPYQPDTHVTQQNLALIDALTIYNLQWMSNASITQHPTPDTRHLGTPPTEFPTTKAEQQAAVAWLQARGIGSDERIVAVHPGAGAAVKRWTASGWASVADAVARWGFRILLTGSAEEAPLTADIARRMTMPVIDAAGATDLGLLAALLARCDLVIGPDAGVLHLATAVGTRTVRLYGPINPVHFGPWGDPARHRVVLAAPTLACQFCDRMDYAESELPLHPCVRWIQPASVLAAARAALAAPI